MVSYATINADPSSAFYIRPDFFTNYGTINGDNDTGGTLDIIPTSWFKNFGTVDFANGESGTIGDGVALAGQPGGVTNEASGTISVAGNNSLLTIGDGTFVNAGLLEALSGATIDVQAGTIINTGMNTEGGYGGILIDGATDFARLVVDTSTLQLTGGGDVTLAGGSIVASNLSEQDPLLETLGKAPPLPGTAP